MVARSLLLVALSLPVAVLSSGSQDSIEALLDRLSKQTSKALPVNTIPKEHKSPEEHRDGDVKEGKPLVVQKNESVDKVKREDCGQLAPPEPKDKLVRRFRNKNPTAEDIMRRAVEDVDAVQRRNLDEGHHAEKRWVWGTSILQDTSPTAGLPPPGENANLLPSATYAVATPIATPVVKLPVAKVAPPKAKHKVLAGAHDRKEKKWVWGPSIINDDTPTSGLPPPGANTNLFTPSYPVNTPVAAPVAPVFPVVSSVAAPVVVAAAATTAPKVKVPANEMKVKIPAHELTHQKKWIWGTSIIQDPVPGQPTPVIPSMHTTPGSVPTPPSFPPLPLTTTTTTATTTAAAVTTTSSAIPALDVVGNNPFPPAAAGANLAAPLNQAQIDAIVKDIAIASARAAGMKQAKATVAPALVAPAAPAIATPAALKIKVPSTNLRVKRDFLQEEDELVKRMPSVGSYEMLKRNPQPTIKQFEERVEKYRESKGRRGWKSVE